MVLALAEKSQASDVGAGQDEPQKTLLDVMLSKQPTLVKARRQAAPPRRGA